MHKKIIFKSTSTTIIYKRKLEKLPKNNQKLIFDFIKSKAETKTSKICFRISKNRTFCYKSIFCNQKICFFLTFQKIEQKTYARERILDVIVTKIKCFGLFRKLN